jgi:hypothetical protein
LISVDVSAVHPTAGFTRLFAIVGEIARAALLSSGGAALLVLLSAMAALATFLAGFGSALRIICEITGTAALFACHVINSPARS